MIKSFWSFSRKKTEAAIPEVAPTDEHDASFRQALRSTLATIQGIDPDEIGAIERAYFPAQNMHLNRAKWWNQMRDEYFRNREWFWPHMELWRRRFQSMGAWPIRCPEIARTAGCNAPYSGPLSDVFYGEMASHICTLADTMLAHQRGGRIGISHWEVKNTLPEDAYLFGEIMRDDPHPTPPIAPFLITQYRPIIPGLER